MPIRQIITIVTIITQEFQKRNHLLVSFGATGGCKTSDITYNTDAFVKNDEFFHAKMAEKGVKTRLFTPLFFDLSVFATYELRKKSKNATGRICEKKDLIFRRRKLIWGLDFAFRAVLY